MSTNVIAIVVSLLLSLLCCGGSFFFFVLILGFVLLRRRLEQPQQPCAHQVVEVYTGGQPGVHAPRDAPDHREEGGDHRAIGRTRRGGLGHRALHTTAPKMQKVSHTEK